MFHTSVIFYAGWALAVVTSRAFRVAGPSQPAAMLPLIDMCNHTFHPNCTLKAQPNGDLQLVTLQETAANQPLTLSYGSLSNDFLLMDYGFVVPNNPFDRVQLSFSLQLMEVRCSTTFLLIMLCSTCGHLLYTHAQSCLTQRSSVCPSSSSS